MSQLEVFIDKGISLHPTHFRESSLNPKRIPILFSLSVTSKFALLIPFSRSISISNFFKYSTSSLFGYLAICLNSVSITEYSAAFVLYFRTFSSAPFIVNIVDNIS